MSSSEQEYNPFQPPAAVHQVPFEQVRIHRWFNLVLLLYLIAILGATIAAFIVIQSILFSGVIASFLGLIIAVLARKARFQSAMWLGVTAPVFSLFCFALIFFNEWGPDDAEPIIPVVIFVYACLAIFWLMMVFLDCLAAEPLPKQKDESSSSDALVKQ